MKYFAIFPDGNKYGPVDIDTLTQWAAEQRINRATILEEEGTGNQIPAASLPGIMWIQDSVTQSAPTATQTPPYAGGGVGMGSNMGDAYQRPVTTAAMGFMDRTFTQTHMLTMTVACLCCNCPMLIFSIVGLIVCKNPEARRRAMTCVIISGVLSVLATIYQISVGR